MDSTVYANVPPAIFQPIDKILETLFRHLLPLGLRLLILGIKECGGLVLFEPE